MNEIFIGILLGGYLFLQLVVFVVSYFEIDTIGHIIRSGLRLKHILFGLFFLPGLLPLTIMSALLFVVFTIHDFINMSRVGAIIKKALNIQITKKL